MFNVNLVTENEIWVTPHPTHNNYGISFDSRSGATDMRLVHGDIDGTSRLQVISDHNAPIAVLSWYFVTVETIMETVNSGDVSAFDSLTKIIYEVTANAKSDTKATD